VRAVSRLLLAASLCAALVTAGCGDAGRADAVKTADAWLDAVAAKDDAAACRVMAKVGVDAVRQKFTELPETAPCPPVMRDYRERLDPAILAAIRKGGVEPEGTVKDNEIGVFPKVKKYELDVILMRRVKGDWKVVSTTIGPPAPSSS
jgi:hypothetical protein